MNLHLCEKRRVKNNDMLVMKFGGSSVKNEKCIHKVIQIIKQKSKEEERLVVVFSAFGGVTDLLISMSSKAAEGNIDYKNDYKLFKKRHLQTAKKLLKKDTFKSVEQVIDKNNSTLLDLVNGVFLVGESSERTQAIIMSFGERNSNYIISEALGDHNISTSYCDARKLIITNDNYLNAVILPVITRKNIIKRIAKSKKKCIVVTGFISATENGLTTVLGRGGSDYTASLIAANTGAHTLEIWTDVDGVLTTDPRKVKSSYSLKTLSYLEAMELSHFGAKVIYPPTIRPVMDKEIPIYIKNTFNPSHPGTKIHKIPNKSKHNLTGISAIEDVSLITLEGSGMQGVPGIAARLFTVLYEKEINIILITQASSEHSITFAIADNDKDRAIIAVQGVFDKEIQKKTIRPIKCESQLSIVAAVGEKMCYQVGLAGKLFGILGQYDINVHVIAQGSSELNISFVIKTEKLVKALNVIHDNFFIKE